MSFLQTSQCQEKKGERGGRRAGAQRSPETCPRKTRKGGVRVRSPPLSPGLRQPPDSPLALLPNDLVEEAALNHTSMRGADKNGSAGGGKNLRGGKRELRRL